MLVCFITTNLLHDPSVCWKLGQTACHIFLCCVLNIVHLKPGMVDKIIATFWIFLFHFLFKLQVVFSHIFCFIKRSKQSHWDWFLLKMLLLNYTVSCVVWHCNTETRTCCLQNLYWAAICMWTLWDEIGF